MLLCSFSKKKDWVEHSELSKHKNNTEFLQEKGSQAKEDGLQETSRCWADRKMVTDSGRVRTREIMTNNLCEQHWYHSPNAP